MPIQWDDETLGVPQKQPVYDGIIWDDDIGIGDASKERGTLGAFAKTALRVPENLAAKTIAAVQGQKGASVVDRGVADRFVNWVEARNRKLAEEYEGTGDFIPGVISKRDVAELGPNLAFSGVSMAGTLGGMTAAAPIPVPGARIAGGLAGGATAAYRMDSYQVMNDWLEKVNQESIKSGLGPISKTEEEKFKKDMSALATEHGAWEAGPEGLANILELALLTAKNLPGVRWLPKGVAGKLAKGGLRFAGVTGVEELTETPTQMGQQIVESKAGMTDEAPREWTSGSDILKSAKEVLPQVLLLSGFMSAGGAAFRKATGTKEKDMPPSAEEETLSEAATLTNMIDEGMTTGGINGQPFTPEIATGIIREAYADKVLTGEDLDNFREKYPDLRPIVNDIIGEKVKAEINKEMEDADARGVLLGENKDVTAKELLTGKREKALTPEAHQGIIEAEMPASTEPTVEIGIEKLPEFSGSTEALTFGKDATPDQIKALKQRREVSLGKFEKLIATRALNKASIEVTKAQLDKEAIDALEILREHPEYLKKPAKEVAPIPAIIKPKLEEKYGRFLEKVGKRLESEAIGQDILDTLEGKKIRPTSVSKTFWEDTFFKLPSEAQNNITKYLQSITGMKPGDVIATLKGKDIKAKDWFDIAKMLGADFTSIEHLEGTERGYIALMAYANEQVKIEPVKPQPPKLPKAKPSEAVRDEIKGEVIPEPTPKVEKEKVGVTPEKKEPWEMGENEYVQSRLEDLKGKIKLTGQARNLYLMEWKDKFTVTHQRSVEKAIQEGKLPKPKKEKVEVEATPEGKEISVDLTKKEEAAVTPKQQKEYLLAEIDKAIEEAPDVEPLENLVKEFKRRANRLNAEAKQELIDEQAREGKKRAEEYGTVTIHVPDDGVFIILNTKQALGEFKKKAKSFPSALPKPKVTVPGVIRKAPLKESIGVLHKIDSKEYFTDGEMIIKGKPPAKAVWKESATTEKNIKNFLATKTEPAELKYYAFQHPDYGEGVTGSPIPSVLIDETYRGIVVFQAKDGALYNYNQLKFNAIVKRFPKAKYGMAKEEWREGLLVAYENKKPVAALMPLRIEDGAVMEDMAVKQGFIKGKLEKPTGVSEERIKDYTLTQDERTKVYVPITRKEADALFDKGAAILVARFNIRGPETTGEEGYYMRLPVQGRVVSYNEREVKSLYEKYKKRHGGTESAISITSGKTKQRDGRLPAEVRDEKAFATKAIKPQDTITRADLKSIFAKMKNVMTGQDKDGNFFFKILGRPKVIIYTVDHIEGYINTSMGRIPVGSFLPGKMELKTEGVGPTADVGSLWHEFFHGLKRMGVISNNDNEALNRAIAKIKGIDEKSITEEDQAYYVGDTLLDWHNQKNLRIKRILKKIADFVNAIYEFVSRTRTARGVLADIETGRLIGKEVAGEKAGVLIPAFQQTAPYWYSQVVKAVEQKFPNKMFARSITNWIKKQGGKPVELEWLGLDEWLEGKNVVTKDELSEFLRANQVEVEEVEKKAEVPRERKLVEDFTNEQLRKVIEHKEIDIDLPVFDRNKAIEVINEEIDAGGSGVRRFIYEIAGLEQYDFGDQIVSETKFGQWQLPGEKENYKELLLTLPYRFGAKPQARISELNKKVEDYTATKEEQIELNRLLESRTAGEFKSPHYDEPNILAHVRFNERTDAEGNKVLFLEEVQSDWALEGRKSGYDKVRPGIIDPFTGEPFEAKFAGVPDMPFKENWYQVALKRMLRYASENGFDKVAWVTGKQTADRYDLSKQINIVQWDHNADGTFDISATSHDLAINPIEKSGLSQDELENLIGKEVAKKVVTHKGQTYKAPDGATSGELSGLDLKVGGEWATQLYDKMIPQYLKKFGKKWGAEVGEIDLGKREGVSAKEEQARQLAGEKPGAAFEENVIVQAITITPQMKQSAIREGMPMFQMAGEKAIGAPTKREGLFKQKGSSLDNEGMELNYTVHIDKHYGYDKNGKYKLIPDKIYYDDVGLNLHSVSLKGLKDEITKAKSIKETKQFATKPSIDYKEMLKKYQEAHTTPAEKAKQAKKSAKDYVKDFTVDYIKVLDRYEAKLKSAETKLEKIKTSKEILKRRRGFIRAAADYFNLSDKELRQISGKDIRFMNNLEFKQYIDGIRIKAEKFEVRRQAMNELMTQIRDKELNVENLRKAMKLPTLKNMTVAQIQHLDETLVPYQKGDEFLTVRKLEVVDRTELEGIKTWREAREHLAKEISKQEGRTVTVKELQNIKVSEFDRFRYDTGLAEKDPFYKMMIEKPAKRMLVSETEYLKMEQEVFALAKEIKGKGFFVPQYKNIMRWMETPTEEKANIKLSSEEMALAEYMTEKNLVSMDYLIQMEAMRMGKQNYFTHVRRGILEAVKEDGIIKAVKEQFKAYKLDEQGFNILDRSTGEVLAYDKWFKFAMHRTGKLKPTQNVVKAFLTYQRTFLKKQALDETTPLIDIYAHALTPKGMTKKGLLLHGNLIKFVKEWINTQKGRHITLIAKQNGKIDAALRAIKMFTSLRDLAFNIPVSVATEVGEQITTYQLLGKRQFFRGKIRQNTKQGKKIIEKYRNLIGKDPWKELAEPSKAIGDRLMEGIFVLFRDASARANKTFLLGSLSKFEFESGIVFSGRLTALRTELGRYRMVAGMKSIIGATPEGKAYTQYKRWAIPILRTTIQNLGNLGKKITFQKVDSKAFKKSAIELYRLAEITAFVMLMFGMVRDEDDNSFTGKIINKAYREATTLIQALQPSMFLTAGRTASFVEKLGVSLTLILQGEKYKTTDEYKGIKKLKRQFTPVAVSQFLGGGDEDLWDRRLRKHKAKLNEIKDDFDKAKDKATFQNKHRKELRALRKANELQGELNEDRKKINRIKSRKETKAGKLEIQRLEKRRTDKIKNHLKKY